MILLRLSDLKGTYCELEGGKKIQDAYMYSVNDQGWMPIDSMSFSLQGASQSVSESVKAPAGGQAGGAQGRTGGGAASAAKPSEAKKEEPFSTISITRLVDRATPLLMSFAMEDRKFEKGSERKLRKADIHFIHSVHTYKSTSQAESDIYIYPYMLVTLANVLIKGWSISAAGDDRPTENLELWFDKAALAYHRTSDGRVWSAAVRYGWDQYANKAWDPTEGEAPFFKQPPLITG